MGKNWITKGPKEHIEMSDMLTFLTLLMVSHISQTYKIVHIFTYIYITLYIHITHIFTLHTYIIYNKYIKYIHIHIFRHICIYLNIYSSFYGMQVALVVKNPLANAGDMGSVPDGEIPLAESMATHSSIPAWRIPWMQKPGA